jgi:transcription initiation factor IIE alpha subunit
MSEQPSDKLDGDENRCTMCGSPISEHDTERHDGECEVCYWSRRFRCMACAAETLVEDKHPVRAGLCPLCGEELDQVDSEQDCERLREMVESIIGRADETSDYDQVRQAMGLLASLVPEPERQPS